MSATNNVPQSALNGQQTPLLTKRLQVIHLKMLVQSLERQLKQVQAVIDDIEGSTVGLPSLTIEEICNIFVTLHCAGRDQAAQRYLIELTVRSETQQGGAQ